MQNRANEAIEGWFDRIDIWEYIKTLPSKVIYQILKLLGFSKDDGPLALEEALQIFEMKELSEYSKKSFNWIYLCKKKQFTASRGLGNAATAAFYEQKLRSLEEARIIIEKQVRAQDGLQQFEIL